MNERGKSVGRLFPRRAWRVCTDTCAGISFDAPCAYGPIPADAVSFSDTCCSVYDAVRKTPTLLLNVPHLGACPDYRRWYDVTKVGRAWAARNEGVLGLLSCRGGHRGRRGQPQPL